MNISTADVYQYRLPFKRPLELSGTTLNAREGLVIHLSTEEGVDGFGEIAPLSGFSPESLEEARTQVLALSSSLCGQVLPDCFEDLDAALDEWGAGALLHPSVRFGMESALLGILAKAQNDSLGHIICADSHSPVPVSGLLSGPDDSLPAQVRALLDAGFTEMKLKVGADRDSAVRRVNIVNDLAYGKGLLHLDVNRAWDVDTAVSVGQEISCAAVSYIEEPFADVKRIPEFFDATMIPVALDESLQQLSFDEVRMISGIDILVLKPTILGGIGRTRTLMQQAEGRGLTTSVSSTFESSLGLSVLASLAGTAVHAFAAAGLDTLKWFERDLLKEPLKTHNGTVETDRQAIGPNDVNFKYLQKIS